MTKLEFLKRFNIIEYFYENDLYLNGRDTCSSIEDMFSFKAREFYQKEFSLLEGSYFVKRYLTLHFFYINRSEDFQRDLLHMRVLLLGMFKEWVLRENLYKLF